MAAASLAIIVLSGCAGPPPFEDRRREAGVVGMVGRSTNDMVAICHTGAAANREEVLRLARAGCARSGQVATYAGRKLFTCALLVPVEDRFDCVPP